MPKEAGMPPKELAMRRPRGRTCQEEEVVRLLSFRVRSEAGAMETGGRGRSMVGHKAKGR